MEGGVALLGMVPPVSVTELAVLVTMPPLHCGVAGVPTTVRPAGNASVKFTPVSGAVV